MIATLLFLCAQSPWVVKDLEVPPSPTRPDEFTTWSTSLPLGDLRGEGIGSFLVEGWHAFQMNPNAGNTDYGLVRAGLNSPSASFFLPPQPAFAHIWGSYWSPGFALLKEPGGWTAVGLHEPGLVTASFPSGGFDGWIMPPPPAPGLPQQEWWDALQPAGDINLDGFDDVLYYAHPTALWGSYVGLIDGASRQVLWAEFIPDGWLPAPIYPANPIGWSDLNGDGIRDVIIGDILWDLATGGLEQTVLALSGLDGSTIWETRTPNGGAGTTGMDIDGDSIPDVLIISAQNEVSALSGVDGRFLWTTNISAMTPLIPQQAFLHGILPPLFFTETVPGQVADTIQVNINGTPLGYSAETENYLVELDAQTGTPVSAIEFPSDLRPWAQETTQPFVRSQPWYLGDVDRDGYTEIARATPVFSNSPPNFPGVASNIIVSKRTLDFPGTLPIGAIHSADIDIPNAPGMSGFLLLSTGFDREQGFSLDGWRTGLVKENLFTWSRGQALTTTLDASGQGAVSFQLPNNPGLIGETVHARFLVPDPAKPGSLWTLSSIGVGEVTP